MMAQAQVMRAAAIEELEAQKIYAEAAKFQSASQDTLNQARNRLGFARTSALLKPGAWKPTETSISAEQPAEGPVTDPEQDPRAIRARSTGRPPMPREQSISNPRANQQPAPQMASQIP
jgi:hypothetical protein